MRFLNSKKFLPKSLSKYIEMVNNWDLYDLLYTANRIRERHCGNKIKFCSIVNAKSGRCSEDCKFCAQSSHYNTEAPEYDLKEPQEILSIAKKSSAPRFCIVTSGRRVDDWGKIYDTIRLLRKETTLKVEASLGCIDLEHAVLLKEAGLARYNHNLETSPNFFPHICTTHSFNDRLNTARAIKKVGLELCCGGIFGLGETWDDRIELACVLKELNPDSVPLNFLHPRPGTPLENIKPLEPHEVLRIIAVFRIILADRDIFICGGREHNLRSLQSWMFYAGANATMMGNYLTTAGNPPEEDLRMIEDLGLCPELF